MKAQWTKLKFASKYGRKKDLEKEEIVEEDFLYKIEPNPEPMFKNTISKSVTVIRKTLNLTKLHPLALLGLNSLHVTEF